jgi:hypothetical protein
MSNPDPWTKRVQSFAPPTICTNVGQGRTLNFDRTFNPGGGQCLYSWDTCRERRSSRDRTPHRSDRVGSGHVRQLTAGMARYTDLHAQVLANCSRLQPRRVLDLGAGTGEASRRILAAHPMTLSSPGLRSTAPRAHRTDADNPRQEGSVDRSRFSASGLRCDPAGEWPAHAAGRSEAENRPHNTQKPRRGRPNGLLSGVS